MIPVGSTASAFGEVRQADERQADGVAAPTELSRLARPPDPAPAGSPRKRLLDLFCGAGGATKGYQRAGFYVVGVDIKPQPRYCGDEFIRFDALDWLDLRAAVGETAASFDAIHASPICQGNTSLRFLTGKQYADLITPTRDRLAALGVPWVIENVPGAPMRPDVVLCGSMFGLGVRRHRWFEFDRPPTHLVNPCVHDVSPVGVYGHPGGSSRAAFHGESIDPATAKRYTTADWREAMGIDWMTAAELAQAIPPAYTEWIGAHLLAAIDGEAFALDLEPPPGLGSNTAGGSGSNGTANATVHEGTARRSRGAEPSAAAVPQT